MDLMHLSFTQIEVNSDSEKDLKKKPVIINVLVMTDHFTHHTMAFMTEDKTAKTVAWVLYYKYVYIFGTPMMLMFNNNLAFTSDIVHELCDLFGVKRIWMSMYHPQCNGLGEQQHQMVIRMIGKLSQDEKANWPKHLSEIIMALNLPLQGLAPITSSLATGLDFLLIYISQHYIRGMWCACIII